MREMIEAERERFAVPGCAVAVVADGEVLLCEGFGLRDVGRGLPVTARTLFPIGSSTKTFTAALCATVVDEGLLDWNRPVREYLPGFRMADPAAADGLTVLDMLCHRSGLPRHDLLWYAAGGELAPDGLAETLRHLEPSRGFRERFQYNNLLYAVAGTLAGRLCGTSYESALRVRVLDRLGMDRTNLSVETTRADPDAARPYVAPGPGDPLTEVPHAPLGLIAPAGAINSCVEELLPWLSTLLGRGSLLSPSVLDVLRTPVMPTPEGLTLTAGRPVGYGLGLLVEDYRGHRVVQHGGNIDGFSAQVAVLPEDSIAVAVLTNRDGTALRDALPYLIYDRLLGLEPRPHGERMLAGEEALHLARSQARRRTATASNGLPPVRPVADYAGRYRHPAYGELAITVEAGGLAASCRGLSGPLEHRHLEVFTLLADLGGVRTPIPLQFFHDVEGEVTAAALKLETAVAPVRFDRVPDTGHLTGELLDSLAGTYRLGPMTARITRRGRTGLVARLPHAAAAELVPVRDLVFTMDGGRVEFDGEVLVTPMGEFTRWRR